MGYYKLNVKNIVEKYCINKDKPLLKCNGKCYLKKQLEFSAVDTSSSEMKNINFAEAFIPVFLNSHEINHLNTFMSFKKAVQPISIQNLFEQLLLFEIEYPPEYC